MPTCFFFCCVPPTPIGLIDVPACYCLATACYCLAAFLRQPLGRPGHQSWGGWSGGVPSSTRAEWSCLGQYLPLVPPQVVREAEGHKAQLGRLLRRAHSHPVLAGRLLEAVRKQVCAVLQRWQAGGWVAGGQGGHTCQWAPEANRYIGRLKNKIKVIRYTGKSADEIIYRK